jgi:hypothetical protein
MNLRKTVFLICAALGIIAIAAILLELRGYGFVAPTAEEQANRAKDIRMSIIALAFAFFLRRALKL